MADLAKELLRTVVRAFYSTEQILIVDALIIHSTLNDLDLAHVCATQPKALRKTLGKLREDGLVSVEVQAERRTDGGSGYHTTGSQQGKERYTNREYYYLNYHHAIDCIKFKMYRLNKHFESLGLPTTERKDQVCPRCKSQYTDLEAMEGLDPMTGIFNCNRCGHPLDRVEEEEIANENDSMKRLNVQMDKILQLMQKIDAATVPENDWQSAKAAQKNISRTDANPAAKIETVDLPNKNIKGTKGLEIKPEKIAVQIQDDEDVKREKAEAEAKEKKEREAKQNALPEWYTRSTVSNDVTAVGAKEEWERKQREANTAVVKDEDGEEKKNSATDDDVMAQYWKELEREKAAEEAREAEEDDDDDDEEEDEFEDVPGGSSTPANGANGTAATSTGMNTPMNAESSNATDDERDPKRPRRDDLSSIANGGSQSEKAAADTPAASDVDEDELEFENV